MINRYKIIIQKNKMDYLNDISFHENINDYNYLDLEMTQYQYNYFSGKLFLNSQFIYHVLRLRTILKNYYEKINPVLFKMNYYFRMVYIHHYLNYTKLIKTLMFYCFESFSCHTTETLDQIKYKSTFSHILFYYLKGYNNFKKFNCPSSLLNISTKKILNIFIQNENLKLESIRKIKLPFKILNMINYNYCFNFNCIEMYKSEDMVNELSRDIHIKQNVIISDILLKHFSDKI